MRFLAYLMVFINIVCSFINLLIYTSGNGSLIHLGLGIYLAAFVPYWFSQTRSE